MKRTEDVAKETSATKCWDLFTKCFKLFKRSAGLKKPTQSEYTLLPEEETDEDYSDFDWWTKFYASIDVKAEFYINCLLDKLNCRRFQVNKKTFHLLQETN